MSQFAWHIHHKILIERIDAGGLAARRQYIRHHKPTSEVKLRLRLLKRVRGKVPWTIENNLYYGLSSLSKSQRRYINALHKKECKRCPWNPRTQTIFKKGYISHY